MDYPTFLDFLRTALTRVEPIYYGMGGMLDSLLNGNNLFEGDPRRALVEHYFRRFDERTFCYELYHQLRCLIEEHRRAERLTDDGVRLQAELSKKQIGEVAAKILGTAAAVEVSQLQHGYIPDFLLHSPGNFKSQGLVMEVKTAPDIPFRDIGDDLLKLQEFIQRYAYGRALLLITNNTADRIQRLVERGDNADWIRRELPTRTQILLFCKHRPDSPLWERNLGSI